MLRLIIRGFSILLLQGANSTAALDDAWAMMLNNGGKYTWQLLRNATQCPSARSSFSFTSIGLNSVLLFGGSGNNEVSILALSATFSDLWSLRINEEFELECVLLDVQSNPPNRAMHAAFFVNQTLFLIGGLNKEDAPFGMNLVALIKVGCNVGSFSAMPLGESSCQLCAVGSFSSSSGQSSCDSCPASLSTVQNGSTSIYQCNICSDAYCSNHGSCSVENFQPGCACHDLYTGSTCYYNNGIHVVLPTVLATTIGVTMIIVAYITLRRRFRKFRYQALAQDELLETSRNELAQIERIFEIPSENITLLDRIDCSCPGAFGEVC